MTGNERGEEGALFARMVDVVGWTIRSIAGEVRELEAGWAVRTPALPQVWSLNQLHLSEPTTAAEALALTDRLQEGLSYRHVEIEWDPSGEVDETLRAAGWRVDREVYMVLAAPPDGPLDTSIIEDLTEDQATELMAMWIEEDHPGISASSRAQLEEYSRREGRLWGERCFGVRDDKGAPVAMTKLRVDEKVAWVEDVFTAPDARGRGYARRLVTLATTLAAAAGPKLSFIIADDNDWPKELYASIGFRPVGRTWTFHRELA